MSIQDKDTITIKPAKTDVNVPKPDGTKLKAEGEEVMRSAYWVRRLKDGDVALVEPSNTNKAANKAEKGE